MRFAPTPDGRFAPNLDPHEREFLAGLPGQLRELLETDDPSLHRLFPAAYHQDPERDEEFRRLMRDDLLTTHRESAELLERTAQSDTLSLEELNIWMNAVNNLRLVLGTQLDVTEGMDLDDMDEQDPRLPKFAVYGWLSMLLEQIIVALTESSAP